MKTYSLLLFLLVHFMSYSQSLTEQAGGITTDFIIYSAADTLNVLDQTIIKRGLSKSEKSSDDYYGNAYGYAYGLQTYRLEFSTSDKRKNREKNQVL